MNSYMNSHFYDLIIWIHILNTSWYPQIHVFSWIHTRYCGFWPYFMEEIVFKFMSVVVWRALWKDREKYRDLIMAWSFKKSSPLNSLALCADALCLMGLAQWPHPTAAALVPPASLSAGPTGCLAELERQHLPLWNYHTLSSGCQSQFESRSDLSADWEISNWRLCLTRSNSVQQLQSGYTFK